MKSVFRTLETSQPKIGPGASAFIGRLMAAVFILAGAGAQATIVGPYTTDTNTLHLWHLDEATVPAVDSAGGVAATNLLVLGGSATLNNPSFAGFGTALSTENTSADYLSVKTLVNGTGDDTLITYADTNTGAFTYECLVRVDFNPTNFFSANPLYFITAENEDTHRPWQWAILAPTTATAARVFSIRFFEGDSAAPNNVSFAIPTNGPDAMIQGNWYHVAVTFSGGASNVTTGTMKWYWTLLDPSRVQANLIGSATISKLVPLATDTPDFAIGNVGRTTANGGFVGLIDEVRMSSIERAPTDMMFNSANVVFTLQPANQTTAVGQGVVFTAQAAGPAPLTYQWRTNGTPIAGATQTVYTISSPTLGDAWNYDVVAAHNANNMATSAVATLTVRVPLNLTWLGSANANWDVTSTNWDSNSDNVADAAFTSGDVVTFDDNGSSAPIVNLTDLFSPSSVLVNASSDYTLMSSTNGAISGFSQLTKEGSGNLIVDTDNTYNGPTVIEGGTVTVGAGDAHGLLGAGPVTNLATLDLNRTDTYTVSNTITGSGNLIKDNIGSGSLSAANGFTGNVTINQGNLSVGALGLGNTTNVVINGVGAGNGTSLSLQGVILGSNVNLSLLAGPLDNRCTILTLSGSNVVNGPMLLDGASSTVMNLTGGSLEINGPVTGAPTYVDYFTLRGAAGPGFLRGTVNLPNGLFQKTDGGTWIVTATNSSYGLFRMLGGVMQLGADNALATNGFLATGGGTLDLAGFNQTFTGISNFSTATIVANSSTNSDSRLTILTGNAWIPTPGVVIADSTAGGTRKVSLTLDGGGALALSATNTYTGDTTINSGSTLILNASGAISNSTVINISSGSTLDASYRLDGTLTLSPGQTLKGDAVFNVMGNIVNNGIIELKVNKAGASLSNDLINGPGSITFGGTLQLDVTASPALTTNDSFTLFSAGGYNGNFSSIIPFVPVFGLAWDTSTLATDGTLRIMAGAATNRTSITAVVMGADGGGGGTLQLAWPANHLGWTLQSQTNAVGGGLTTNWVNVAGSELTNQLLLPVDPTQGSVFYRLVYP